MSEPTTKVKSLIDLLDEEFGKKPKVKKLQSDKEIVKALNKEYHQRNYTGTVSDILAESNAIASSWKNQPGWKPVHRTTWIITECCDNCLSKVSYVGNTFTVFENKRLRSKIQAPELITHDELGFELPQLVDEAEHTVPLCAACLRLSKRVEDHIAAALINGVPKQVPLIFSGEKTNG